MITYTSNTIPQVCTPNHVLESHYYTTSICTNNFNNIPQPKSLKHEPILNFSRSVSDQLYTSCMCQLINYLSQRPCTPTKIPHQFHHPNLIWNFVIDLVYIVITEISSAHGYKNSSSSNNDEVIHGPELTPKHS